MNRIKLLLLGLCLSSTAVGCAEDVDSENVDTDGVHADYTALSSKKSEDGVVAGGGTQLSAYLRTGGAKSNTFLDLTGGDELIISTPDETQTLTGDNQETDFEGDEDGLEFTFAFMRGGDFEDAPDSTVTLPPNFEILGLEPVGDQINAERSRGERLELTLDGLTSGEVEWEIEGTCILSEDGTADVGDDGTIVIPANVLELKSGEEDEPCGAKIGVSLENKGKLDPALGSGTVRGIRQRWFTFVSTP